MSVAKRIQGITRPFYFAVVAEMAFPRVSHTYGSIHHKIYLVVKGIVHPKMKMGIICSSSLHGT